MPADAWYDTVNPFGYLAGTAAKVVADGWTAAMLGLWNAGLFALRLVLGIMDAFLTPDLGEGGPGAGLYATTFWIAGTLATIMGMVQLGTALLRRDGRALGELFLGLAQFAVVWAAWVVYAVAVVAACSGLTEALMASLLKGDVVVGVAALGRLRGLRHHRRDRGHRPGSARAGVVAGRDRASAGPADPGRVADGAGGHHPDLRGRAAVPGRAGLVLHLAALVPLRRADPPADGAGPRGRGADDHRRRHRPGRRGAGRGRYRPARRRPDRDQRGVPAGPVQAARVHRPAHRLRRRAAGRPRRRRRRPRPPRRDRWR